MAGHSKWANIRHRKERVDNKRGKVFSRLVKEIYVAVKLGGEDESVNPRLRLALQKAKVGNLPKDNIDKAVKRGSGKLEGAAYEEIRYEGYGPDGIAIIVECLSDNRNRTTADVRFAFSKFGGTLGTDGSVSFMFDRVGQFLFAPGRDVNKLIDLVIEVGADDYVIEEDGSVEVICSPDKFVEILDALEKHESAPESAELVMRANNPLEIEEAARAKARKLFAALEDCEDTQTIYSNAQFLV